MDDEKVGMAHEVKSPQNQPQFSQTTVQNSAKLSGGPEILSKSCQGILFLYITEFLLND